MLTMLVTFLEYRAPAWPRPKRKPVQFTSLPLEIRDMIWELSLHEERVFHVKAVRYGPVAPPVHAPYVGSLVFHGSAGDFRPPVATRVCSESRRAAWRAGCFLFQSSAVAAADGTARRPSAGMWFNPKSDVLYWDRNQRDALSVEAVPGGAGPFARGPGLDPRIAGLDRVEHVAVEWRWFLQDGSRRLDEYAGDAMRAHWARKTDRLYAHMPALRTMHYVLPQVRHQGGLPWGREPEAVLGSPIRLTDLPPPTVVPMESGHRSWELVRAALAAALGVRLAAPGQGRQVRRRHRLSAAHRRTVAAPRRCAGLVRALDHSCIFALSRLWRI